MVEKTKFEEWMDYHLKRQFGLDKKYISHEELEERDKYQTLLLYKKGSLYLENKN